jgi:hypothetical protein
MPRLLSTREIIELREQRHPEFHDDDCDLCALFNTTAAMISLLDVHATYSDDEPRDSGGRWTSGGGGDDSSEPDDEPKSSTPIAPTPTEDLKSMSTADLDAHMEDVTARQNDGIAKGLDTLHTYDMIDGVEGQYTEARQQQQQQIINGFLNKTGVESDHKLLIMAGLPGAGKTTFLNNNAESLDIDPKTYVDVNPDEVKAAMATAGMVPDYSDLGLTPQEYGSLIQEEASTISVRVALQAAVQGKNIAVDSTMKSNNQFNRYVDIVNEMSPVPYDSTMILIDATKEESLANATKRYATNGGRFVPLKIIKDMPLNKDGQTPPRVVFDENADKVDRAILVNNERVIQSDTKPNAPVETTPDMLAKMHSNDLRDPDGGFTLDPATGAAPPGTGDFGPVGGPYAVAVGDPYSSGAIPATPAAFVRDATGYSPMSTAIRDFVVANADKLKEPGMHLGGWHAVDDDGKDTGLAYLDVTEVIPRGDGALEYAKSLGASRDQLAVTDLNDFHSIPTGGSGEKKR